MLSFRALALLIPLVLSGCEAQSGAPTAPLRPKLMRVAAPAAMRRAVSGLQRDYAQSDWSGLRARISDPATGSMLVGEMQRWARNGVVGLHAILVYSHRVAARRYVGTVEFSVDRRVVPAYDILLFDTAGSVARILGADPGIGGSTYRRADWDVTRTGNFVVYHSPYQLVGSDRRYLADLAYQRRQFAAKFRVRLPLLAALYLYPSRSLMSKLTAHSCGFRPGEIGCTSPFSQPPTIQTTIGAIYHEPVHVYELALAPGPVKQGKIVLHYVAPRFIAEGTAVALQDREADPRLSDYCSDLAYAPLDDCARAASASVDPMSILSDHGFKQAPPGEAYALGGSFVKYLILRSGYYRFGRFYYKLAAQPKDRVRDYDVAARSVYHQSIRSLIDTWKSKLCTSGC